jgi:hypothetical protein
MDKGFVLEFPPETAEKVRRMNEKWGGISNATVVQRALILLDLYLSLEQNERLSIYNLETKGVERVTFKWEEL